MSHKTLRTGLSLVFTSMLLAGCASYSGLNTEGVSQDGKNLEAARTLAGIAVSRKINDHAIKKLVLFLLIFSGAVLILQNIG